MLCAIALFAIATIFSGGASADNWIGSATAPTENPTGTFLIGTADELAWVADQVTNQSNTFSGKTIKLTDNINLAGKDWTPIGTDSNKPFRGTFDGDGYTISNMKVAGDIQYAGLFGTIYTGGSVKNLALRDVDVSTTTQDAYAGALAGYIVGSSIANVTVTGRVETTGTDARVGGLVGHLQGDSPVTNNLASCASSCTVVSVGGSGIFGSGGLVGVHDDYTITGASLATGSVTATGGSKSVYVGGFAGQTFNGDGTTNRINNSLAAGRVIGTGSSPMVGGFLGFQDAGSCATSAFDSDSTGQTGATYNNGTLPGVTSMTTVNLIVGTSVPAPLNAASWDVRPGYYPMPKALLDKPGTAASVAYIAMVMPITLGATDTAMDNVTAPFTIPKKDAAGNDITWIFSSENAVSFDIDDNDTYTVGWTAATDGFVLSADMPGGTRGFKLDLKNATVYTVTFDSQGGSDVDGGDILTGRKITKPTDPTKENHVFGGWYKDAACTNEWNFDTDTVTANTTLYAKWTLADYTVTFNSNGGSVIAPIGAAHGKTITAPTAPTKVGHTFAGWYKDVTFASAWNFDTDTVTSDITLYAKWTVNDTPISVDEALDILDADPELSGNVAVTLPSSADVLAVADEITAELSDSTITTIDIVETVPANAFEPRPTTKISGTLDDKTTALVPSVSMKIPTTNGNAMPMTLMVLENAISNDLKTDWADISETDKADYLTADSDGTATVFAYEYVKSDGTATAPAALIGRGGPYTWAYAVEKNVVTFNAAGDITLNYIAIAANGEPFIAGGFLVIPDKQPNPGYITDPVWLLRETKDTEDPTDPTGGSSGVGCNAGIGLTGVFALMGLGAVVFARRRK